jgi:hypothetical protein
MKICQETPNLVKIRQKYWALYKKSKVHLCFSEQYKISFSSKTVQSKSHSCVSMSTFNGFIMLTATYKSTTIESEYTVMCA